MTASTCDVRFTTQERTSPSAIWTSRPCCGLLGMWAAEKLGITGEDAACSSTRTCKLLASGSKASCHSINHPEVSPHLDGDRLTTAVGLLRGRSLYRYSSKADIH